MPNRYNQTKINALLCYCRAGFEQECAAELHDQLAHIGLNANISATANSAYVLAQLGAPQTLQKLQNIRLQQLVFARQLLFVCAAPVEMPGRDRLTPILDTLASLPALSQQPWLETPDTNDGKSLSGFCKRFAPLLEQALQQRGQFKPADKEIPLPRLHLFFPAQESCLIALSIPNNRSEWLMGIPRLKMPHQAPSRSTLKLAEALLTLLDDSQLRRIMQPGMRAVDLGAAPGGWTWQLSNRGLKVTAVDNGPLKGEVRDDPLVQHVRADGFKYRPKKPVDWMVCDMVEQPIRIAQLAADWLADGWARQVIVNFKLPMKKRYLELQRCVALLDQRLERAGMRYQIHIKQLYHDREEVTAWIGRV